MYTVSHTIENGIERIVYTPKQRKFDTPIVMQHGMWHGAWCWQPWQELLAEWGWESHAHSLPSHAGSPVKRPIRWCTLGYYLQFLAAEVGRMPHKPILMGHSMGGALTQWYLKYVADDLPAAVLVAPWTSHNMWPAVLHSFRYDFVGAVLSLFTLTTTPMVRNPYRAARMFITEGANLTPEALHARLGAESTWVLLQYNPLLWQPIGRVKTPMLWLAGEADLLINETAESRSAAHYGAKYVVVPKAGHNLMMERSYRETAEMIQAWLCQQTIP